jgi:hypothetical protein
MSDGGRYEQVFDDDALSEFVRNLDREIRKHADAVHHDLLDQNVRMHERIVTLEAENAMLKERMWDALEVLDDPYSTDRHAIAEAARRLRGERDA